MPDDNTLILLCLLIFLGGLIVGIVLQALRATGQNFWPSERCQRAYIIAALIVIALLTVNPAPDIPLTPIDRALVRVPPERVVVDLSHCPPAMPGTTDQLLMTIETRSDTTPLVTGCTRIAEREYTATASRP